METIKHGKILFDIFKKRREGKIEKVFFCLILLYALLLGIGSALCVTEFNFNFGWMIIIDFVIYFSLSYFTDNMLQKKYLGKDYGESTSIKEVNEKTLEKFKEWVEKTLPHFLIN